MKKLLTVLAIVLFTINANAQEAKASAKETPKKEACCSKHEAKAMTSEEMAKCQAKCKAEGKVCTADKKAECKKDSKKCCAKKA